MTLKIIYLSLIVIITLWTIYLYINHDQEYKNEIQRITVLKVEIGENKIC